MTQRIDVAVTDTHSLIWAITGQLRRLGARARRFFERVDAGDAALFLPTIVLVELGEAHRDGDFVFPRGMGLMAWLDAAVSTRRQIPLDLTLDVVREAQTLYEIPERGDRLIAAHAVIAGCPLITRDPTIERWSGVEILW